MGRDDEEVSTPVRYLIAAKPACHHIHAVEEREQRGGGLVDGAHDGAALARQQPQQHHQVTDRHHVQTSAIYDRSKLLQ